MTTVRRLIGNDYSFGQGRASLIGGLEAIYQSCKTRLLQFQGEWFLDANAGTPWRDVLGRTFNQIQTEKIIRNRLGGVEGVSSVAGVSVAFDRQTRTANIQASITTIYGIFQLRESILLS